jgi:hypothetical protein
MPKECNCPPAGMATLRSEWDCPKHGYQTDPPVFPGHPCYKFKLIEIERPGYAKRIATVLNINTPKQAVHGGHMLAFKHNDTWVEILTTSKRGMSQEVIGNLLQIVRGMIQMLDYEQWKEE